MPIYIKKKVIVHIMYSLNIKFTKGESAMKIKVEENTGSVSRLLINVEKSQNIRSKERKEKKDKTVNSINASTLNLADDPIEKKRKQAQSMALSLVSNVFSDEQKIDKDLKERQEHINNLIKENEEYSNILKDVNEQKNVLKEQYNITDDSQEQQDLELLRKEKNSMKYPGIIKLSDEEKNQLESIHTNGLTDYQKSMLQLDEAEKEYKGKIIENQKSIIEENAVISGVQIERLKSHDMVDAGKQSKQIVTAANKEIIGMLYEDVKEKQDKKLEEQQKAADKKKEEKEALEKRIEAAKPDKEKYAAKFSDLDDMYKLGDSLGSVRKQNAASSTMQDIKKSLSQVISELKLTAEDLKGAVVDVNL